MCSAYISCPSSPAGDIAKMFSMMSIIFVNYNATENCTKLKFVKFVYKTNLCNTTILKGLITKVAGWSLEGQSGLQRTLMRSPG